MVDSDDIKKAIKLCARSHETLGDDEPCKLCPYNMTGEEGRPCYIKLQLDAAAIIDTLLGMKSSREIEKKQEIEIAELTERNQALESEVARERAYNNAIVSLINNREKAHKIFYDGNGHYVPLDENTATD